MSESQPYHVDLDPSALKLALEQKGAPGALQDLLSQLVEAAGGSAGVITTSLDRCPHTCVYGLPTQTPDTLVSKMEDVVATMAEPENEVSDDVLADLEREARSVGSGRPLAIPVHSGGRSVGVLCLWHPADLPPVLEDTPGLVHIQLDELETGLQNARLLERLLAEKRWLEAAVQHSSDGVVIIDEAGRIVGFNLAMSRLSGRRLGDGVGEPYHQTFPLAVEDDSDSTALQLAQDQRLLNTTSPVEAKLLAQNGMTVDVELCGAPLWDRQGKPLGWVMTLRDISRRKEMEKLQKLFLSAVSHELQTPIAIIRGYAGLIADPDLPLSIETAREKAAIIVEESQRLEKMVQQMLYANRIQAGGVRLHQDSLDLASFLKRTVEKMQPLLGKSTARVEVPPDLPSAHADSAALQQVVGNLLENAVKYAPGKPIVVSARSLRPGWLRVEVTDSGPGIPAEERGRIFSPFERGGDPLKSRVRGAGLGLYICKAIVEAHGGKIGVEGGKSGGACFSFTLPAEVER